MLKNIQNQLLTAFQSRKGDIFTQRARHIIITKRVDSERVFGVWYKFFDCRGGILHRNWDSVFTGKQLKKKGTLRPVFLKHNHT